jgi:hypothetical protein
MELKIVVKESIVVLDISRKEQELNGREESDFRMESSYPQLNDTYTPL